MDLNEFMLVLIVTKCIHINSKPYDISISEYCAAGHNNNLANIGITKHDASLSFTLPTSNNFANVEVENKQLKCQFTNAIEGNYNFNIDVICKKIYLTPQF